MLSKSPLAFKQSLEQRLLNEAKEQNVDVQRLRQFAIYERFLARIFAIFQEEAGTILLKLGVVSSLTLDAHASLSFRDWTSLQSN